MVNTSAVAVATVIITWFLRERFEAAEKHVDRLDDRLESVRSELGSEIATLRSELGSEIAAVRSELSATRSDLTAVALAVGARPRSAGGHG